MEVGAWDSKEGCVQKEDLCCFQWCPLLSGGNPC